LNIPWAVILSQDSFYKDLEGEDLERAKRNEYNFDHPGTCVCVCLFAIHCTSR